MADYALDQVMEMEHQRDRFWSGDMSVEESTEKGFTEGNSYHNIGGYPSNKNTTYDVVPTTTKPLIKYSSEWWELEDLKRRRHIRNTCGVIVDTKGIITLQVEDCYDFRWRGFDPDKSVKLTLKQIMTIRDSKVPVCNVCESPMKYRHGKYGKFYYCGNNCKKQKCVSDKYWQLLKKRVIFLFKCLSWDYFYILGLEDTRKNREKFSEMWSLYATTYG